MAATPEASETQVFPCIELVEFFWEICEAQSTVERLQSEDERIRLKKEEITDSSEGSIRGTLRSPLKIEEETAPSYGCLGRDGRNCRLRKVKVSRRVVDE